MNLDSYRIETPPRREILPSGVVLLSHSLPGSHSIALGVWLRTGTQVETPELSGLAHFLEHIVFKGSDSRSAYEIALAFDSVGAAVDAFTTKDHVAFTLKVLPEYFDTACEVLADMLLRPAMDPQLVTLEQAVICEEIQEAHDTPEERLHDAFAAHVFAGHPRGRPILGTPTSVRSFDSNLLQQQHRLLFTGPNLVISLAGNLENGARETVWRHFEGVPPAAAPAEVDSAAVIPDTGAANSDSAAAAPDVAGARTDIKNGRIELHSAIVQSYFEIGNLAVSYRHPDRIPLRVLSNVLGGGMSSRIFQAVREREGLAYTIYTYCDMGHDVGLVSCAGACTPDNIERVEDLVRCEYRQLLHDGVQQEELANNCAQIKSQLVFSLEGVLNQMYRNALNEIQYGRFIPVAELVDQIDSVDCSTILRCAESYFHPDNLIIATHGPA